MSREVCLMEAWGDLVDPREYLFDDPSFNNGFNSAMSFTTPADRTDGKFRPFFETEQDLHFIRGGSRLVAALPPAICALTNLGSYTISDGFTHKVEPADDATLPALVDAAQRIIDSFMDDNDFKADLESEIHWRCREDGECALALRPRGWRTEASIVEPEHIAEPASQRDLEMWLGTADAFVNSWSFGVHTRRDEPWRPLGYHVSRDPSGGDWDYFVAGDVPLALELGAGLLELFKRNVPRNVKRGISDLFPVLRHISKSEKLVVNAVEGTAIQAAIAFVREHASTATAEQIGALRSSSATATFQRPVAAGGTRTVHRQQFAPGTVIDTNGTQYKPGPLGASNGPNVVPIIQAGLRWCAMRWSMPEYMISSNAENANYSSTLIAGSPFVQARQADQRFFRSRFHRVDWLVLRIAHSGGRLDRFGLSWEEVEAALRIDVTPPDISISDRLQNAQVNAIEHQAGVLSSKSWAQKSGHDYEVERGNLDAEPRRLYESSDYP